MSFNIFTGLLALAAGIGCSAVNAIEANPNPITDFQPDGSVVELRVKGDEHFNWQEDLSGYTLVQQQGWYKYAELNSLGQLQASRFVLGTADPKKLGLRTHLMPAATVQNTHSISRCTQNSKYTKIATTGVVKNLVVLIRFADHIERSLPTPKDFNILFNKPGGDAKLAPTGSVRDLLLQNSYGQMTLDSTVTAWVTLSHNESYYANTGLANTAQATGERLWQGLQEALSQLDTTLDFSDFDRDGDGIIDAISFVHSGYGAEWGGTDQAGASQTSRIWSHYKSMPDAPWLSEEGIAVDSYQISPALWGTSGSEIGRIGVIVHEIGHAMGLPDLYASEGNGEGIGSFGLMANAWDFEGTQFCPPHLSPWSKEQLGWYVPKLINAAGEYSLRLAEQYPDVYKVTRGFPQGEYLLIENRQNAGFDCTMPQGGLAVWYIDENVSLGFDKNGKHYPVALLQADAQFDLEKGLNRGDAGDVYHAGGVFSIETDSASIRNTNSYHHGNISETGNRLDNVSISGNTMTFCLNGCSTSTSVNAPSHLSITFNSQSQEEQVNLAPNTRLVELNWQDNADNEELYVIERCQLQGLEHNSICHFIPLQTLVADTKEYRELISQGIYKYRVKAVNDLGSSAYSNEITIRY